MYVLCFCFCFCFCLGFPRLTGAYIDYLLPVPRHGFAHLLPTVLVVAQVAVFDVVELAPIPGFRPPDFLAAKLVYKLFSYALRNRKAKNNRSKNG